MISVLLLVNTLAVLSLEQSTSVSPCPGVFMYEEVSEPGIWHGVINLTTEVAIVSMQLDILLDSKADLLGNWVGAVSTPDNIHFTIENSTISIQPGNTVAVRLFVRYEPYHRAPKLVSIKLNAREVCDIEPPSRAPTIKNNNDDYINEEEDFDDDFEGGAYVPSTNFDEGVCGKVYNPVPLVVSGKLTLEGQWPWHVALYKHRQKTGQSSYICGGTLVSSRHIITAAHCVTTKNSRREVTPHMRVVHLGKHNLRTSKDGTAEIFVKKITRHPEYDKTSSHSHDLAILELEEAVQFSSLITPACLWPEDQTDLKYVIGNDIVGSVVGWGSDETGALTEDLRWAEMPVVQQETCLRSGTNIGFYVRYTSSYTYCAGYKNGTSVCTGDSGGGMVFKLKDTWYLRGLVSLSPGVGSGEIRCDPHQYIIFTDLAKFLPWIKEIIGL